MLDPMIPPELKNIVERELESGERVEWSGMPRPVFFNAASIGIFLFGLPWTAFAFFWTGAAAAGTWEMEEGLGWFSLFPLFGVPFILIGLAMLSTPLWTYAKALKTVYVITDRRAITFEGGRSTTIRSYEPSQLKTLYRREKRDGSGDVLFAKRSWRDSDGDRRVEEIGFLRIDDARDVERRLEELAELA